MTARSKGYFWVEHLASPWESERPLGIRALLTESGGLPAAFLHCYGRKGHLPARLAVLSPSGEVLEEDYASEDACPPKDLVARLEALARRARSVKNEDKQEKGSVPA